jgi:hypothetical protein
MGHIRWRDIRVGAPLFAVAIALVIYFPHDWAIMFLCLVGVILLLVALASNISRWRNPLMEPEHAKRMQAIARSLDGAVLSNSTSLSFDDGQGNTTINKTCFLPDFPDLEPLLWEWGVTPQVIAMKVKDATQMIEAAGHSQWPTFHPLDLGPYAARYVKGNLFLEPSPPIPAIALSPPEKPSQLLQVTGHGVGTVLFTYQTGLTGSALVEAVKDEAALRQWVVDMLRSPDVDSWRAAVVRQRELRRTLIRRLEEISVQTSLPRGKCTVRK